MSELVSEASGRGGSPASILVDEQRRARLRRRRLAKDRFSRYGVAAGGLGVVVALTLIFVYLVYEVVPLFGGAELNPVQRYEAPGEGGASLHLAVERYQEVGARFTDSGEAVFFAADGGQVRANVRLPIPAGIEITAFAASQPASALVAYGLSDGSAMVAKHEYLVSYPDDRRTIDPELGYPLGEAPLVVDPRGQALTAITVQEGATGTAIAAATADGRLTLARYSTSVSFMTGEVQVTHSAYELEPPARPVQRLLLDSSMRNLYAVDASGTIHYYDISRPAESRLWHSVAVVPQGETVTAIEFLLGTVSLIVGGSDGSVTQWFPVRDAQNHYALTRVREFVAHTAPVTAIAPEHSRKGFVTGDAAGAVALHYPTSAQTLLQRQVADSGIGALALSPVNRKLLASDAAGQLHVLAVANAHPEISFSSLWQKVWYEGRAAPEYIWQASSASDEFEPKMSLVPLSLGTLKAAFFAMLFAMPLAVMGAIYTAYFMTPKLRGVVKPTIEIMEALPTVILGFLAGLWLAPFIENNLPSVFSILILMPIGMLLLAFAWSLLPDAVRHRIPGGWEAALLIPVVLFIGWLSVTMSPVVEVAFFDGSMRQWLTDVGITYDQRNALVVGIAMGFAVIPTIFSIAEDAVFNVPKHLTQGSLALGATPWQTVTGVVLLTASPGIFSAVMIGFGRAVGETMIVLMATGNSPVVNFNIFEGMRTLSANIAVELPESAVGSSHFRVLFLAALVLFALTFVVNTVAEVVRQRLRKKYSSM